MRDFFAALAFVLCVICMALAPFTAPTFAEAFGAIVAMGVAVILLVCAFLMAQVCIHFLTVEP
jgi:low affinity Fe/Cu permease